MDKEAMRKRAREMIERAIEDIEWYQVLESLDFDATDADANDIYELIHGAYIDIALPS